MYLVSYDIACDRTRTKIAKLMENYGRRVQYSVFECQLDQGKYEEMYQKLMELLQEEEAASIRIYSVCERCRQKMVIMGDVNTPVELEKVYVI